jgi:hypothetical protein
MATARGTVARIGAALTNPEVPHRAREWAVVALGLPAFVSGVWALLEVLS